MYLKSLTLKGFKSFADKSMVTLEPGVTCVVGPNGSGKSNITDAILWVLGEQSAKSLRGSTMEDVIFAGSSARQGVGVAEVELVLDNADRTIPLEFDEVSFVRRMYRSGESEYFINMAPARLMDILDLLHDSGMGREMHSIISQGRIDEILRARPEERRALIEEVAGTLKHKKRKERALRRLSALDLHLERARDLRGEVERQLRPMQRQAQRAEKQKELVTQLRESETALATDDVRVLQARWEDTLKREKEIDAQIELTQHQHTTQEEELNKLQLLLEEKGLFVGDLSEQRRRTSMVLERLAGITTLVGEKAKNIDERIGELAKQVADAHARITTAQQQAAESGASQAESQSKLKILYERLGELRKEAETLKKSRTALDDELAKLKNGQRAASVGAEKARTAHTACVQAISTFETQQAMLEERLTSLATLLEASTETLREGRGRLEVLDRDVEKVQREMALAQTDINKRVRVAESRRGDTESAREAMLGVRAELKNLEELADTEYLLTPATDTDIFRTDIDAATHTSILAAGTDRLIDLLTFDEQYRNALEYLAGDAYVVDDIDRALERAQERAGSEDATCEGVVVWPGGKITVGARQADVEGTRARAQRIGALRKELPKLEKALKQHEKALSEADVALQSAQQDAFEIGQRLAELSGQHASCALEVARSEEAVSAHTIERDTLQERLAALHKQYEQAQSARDEHESAISTLETELADFDDKITTLEAQRESRFAEETRLLATLNECQVEIAQVAERDSHLKRMSTQASTELASLERIIAGSDEIEVELETIRTRFTPLADICRLLTEYAQNVQTMLNDRAQFEQTDATGLRDTIGQAQEKLRALATQLTQQREKLAEVRVEKGQLDIQVNAAVKTITDELGIPLETALELPPLEDRTRAQNEAMALRQKLSALGAVNPIAAREYEQLKERSDFMQAQIADINEARVTLGKVVRAIDRKMRERFISTFEQVDMHFQSVFGVLFPGGSAQLVLTDPENLDESGIEYLVQPQGKKLRKMSLLSGGENSLSALALLFAMNRVRPSPFFVLDEVEAALDDANLRRFVMFINSLRATTQFLIVTHQRRTMEMADVLYGVSMQSDGISKLVSQKLEGALEELGYDTSSTSDGRVSGAGDVTS
ncbi:MAG: AAA family ATPase [Coriobacteriia bacterium]|nr:AAA family ATPase [Coriobacteriia bacterium]